MCMFSILTALCIPESHLKFPVVWGNSRLYQICGIVCCGFTTDCGIYYCGQILSDFLDPWIVGRVCCSDRAELITRMGRSKSDEFERQSQENAHDSNVKMSVEITRSRHFVARYVQL